VGVPKFSPGAIGVPTRSAVSPGLVIVVGVRIPAKEFNSSGDVKGGERRNTFGLKVLITSGPQISS